MPDTIWAQLAGTVFLGIVGLWLAHNYRRQIRLKLAERQVDAYTDLWKLTALATPDRQSPLDRAERQKLSDEMARWYHADGNGILVSVRTRDLFLGYKSNLVCPTSEIKPTALAKRLATLPEADAERCRGCVSKRQASILRSQLKNDLVLHIGFAGYRNLRSEDRAFLRSCGLPQWRRPWRSHFFWARGVTSPNPCVCGTCPS
jgi:hypothetical protein